jgi:TPR repeat protein
MPAMLRFMSRALCCFCCLWLGAAQAAGSVQPEPAFDGSPPPAAPLRAADPTPETLSASQLPPAPLQAREPPSALEAEVSRLRARALSVEPQPGRVAREPARAAWLLGLMYLHGIGVAASPAEAAVWFDRARALGEPLAAAGLAWCEIDGCRMAPNPAAAQRWIAQLRRVDLPRAQFFQWLVDERLSPLQLATPGLRGEPAPAKPAPDRQLLLSAARGGNVHARIELGFESIGASRPEEALEHFRAAAPRSEAASANAALLSERLRGTPAARGSASAADTFARAQRNHRGEGQPANFVEAIRLYRLAQSQGSEPARKMLEMIFSRPGPDGQVDIAWMQQLAYLNLSGGTPVLDSTTVRRELRREPTPLFDMLPAYLRK